MNTEKFDIYKARFFEGTLSPEEELIFEKLLLESENTDNEVIQCYFELAQDSRACDFLPVSKEQFFFFVDINKQKKRRRFYWIAATMAGIMIAFGSYWAIHYPKRTKTITQTDLDRSFETTKLALNSFSIHLNKGLKSIDRGMNFSRPFDSLSKIKTDQIETNK